MARDFNGTDQEVSFGSDASIDGFTLLTYAMWIIADAMPANDFPAGKITNLATLGHAFGFPALNNFGFVHSFTGTDGQWRITATQVTGTLYHLVLTYDSGAVGNVPKFWLDGVDEAVTTIATPTGAAESDAAQSLVLGEGLGGVGGDFDGRIQHFAYDNTIWDSAKANRHRWWGRPGGAVQVLHPLVTDKLANEGTATAAGTATGATMASLPRVQRPGVGILCGCGL